MDNFKIVYRILRILEKAMDLEEIDNAAISNERLGLTEARWSRIMALIVSEGYITGIKVTDSFESNYPIIVVGRPEITLKGLEYLEENTLMKKAAAIAKGIKDITPGI